MNERRQRHRARRRLHPGPGVAVGGRGRSAPSRASGSLDLCAAPGGKATALAGAGATVVAADVRRRPGRPGRRRTPTGSASSRRGSAWSWPTAAARRSRRARSTGSWSMPRARASASLRRRARCPVADRRRRRSTASPRSSASCSPAAPLVRPGGTLVVLGVHAHRGRDHRGGRRFAAAHPGLGRSPPPGDAVAAVGERRLPAAPGRRHRRHGRVHAGRHPADDRRSGTDLVPASPARQGRSTVLRRRRSTAPARTGRPRPCVERARPRPASTWSTARGRRADGVEAVADALRDAGRRVRRPGGHHRRHRLRSPRPHPRGHPASCIEREAPGLAEAMRLVNPLGRLSRGIAGTVGQALVLNVPGLAQGRGRVPRGRARRRAPRPRPPGRRPPPLTAAPSTVAVERSGLSATRATAVHFVDTTEQNTDAPSRGWVQVPTGGRAHEPEPPARADPVRSRGRRSESGWERGRATRLARRVPVTERKHRWTTPSAMQQAIALGGRGPRRHLAQPVGRLRRRSPPTASVFDGRHRAARRPPRRGRRPRRRRRRPHRGATA